MKIIRKHYSTLLLIIPIYAASLAFRISGLFANHPFWVDEFSSAEQAKLILRYGTGVFVNHGVYFEANNVLTHGIIALSFKLFGFHEWAARLPFAIIGSFVPVFAYLLGKKIGGKWTGISAALLCMTSYFLITWSRQARGYMLLDVFTLAGFIVYLDLKKKHTRQRFMILATIFALGLLTHLSYGLLILSVIIDVILTKQEKILHFAKRPVTYAIIVFAFVIAGIIGLPMALHTALSYGSFLANNAWYYHSFLWREYGLITFLSVAGLILLIFKNKKYSSICYFFIFHLVFFCFIFKPYSSRYLLPLFPLFFVCIAYLFSTLVEAVSKKRIWILLPTLFIIGNGYKFDVKPNKFYSVNHDFREIALIDYTDMYKLIKQKGDFKNGKTVLIETWWDRARWYMGDDIKPLYAFRWDSSPGLINGLAKHTPYVMNNGKKMIPLSGDVQLVSTLSDLKGVMKDHPKGFLFIDDISMSQEVIEYAKTTMKKEWYSDHYPLDDNPYSIWPATLYSWGL